jgi:hypothetical protein
VPCWVGVAVSRRVALGRRVAGSCAPCRGGVGVGGLGLACRIEAAWRVSGCYTSWDSMADRRRRGVACRVGAAWCWVDGRGVACRVGVAGCCEPCRGGVLRWRRVEGAAMACNVQGEREKKKK